MTSEPRPPESIEETRQHLLAEDYVADRRLATAVFLALSLERPLFLEGEPGTGKTEVAKALARGLSAELIRLQCYEGLDVNLAAYEWNYARQMLEIRLGEAAHESREQIAASLFSERFLIARPLLRSLLPQPVRPILLIDELDRADEPFEAYLLEVLAEFQITIPELTTIRAERPPIVVITSNRTREIHDAVKRRCIYHWVDYPDAVRELEIIRRRVPHVREALARQIVAFVRDLRSLDLYKLPGLSETIEWGRALLALDRETLDPQTIDDTLGVLLKYQDDLARVRGSEAARLLEKIGSRSGGSGSATTAAGPD
ncbi:MAG TPA: MoxR family ATPase [Steroidobacteraceae bacterium]|nr:MoxR family ATPase [Steroidobacteraceae bacterium]